MSVISTTYEVYVKLAGRGYHELPYWERRSFATYDEALQWASENKEDEDFIVVLITVEVGFDV